MLYTNKEIIFLSGISSRTYFRKLKELKQNKKFKKVSTGYFYTEAEAVKICKQLGFLDKFIIYTMQNLFNNGKTTKNKI